MRTERTDFLRRLRALQSACDEPLLVNTASPEHSERAKQLRCGLCVMAFSALEEFVRERISIVLDQITPASLPFAMLPQSFQTAVTLTATKNIANQAQYFPEHQRLAMLTTEFKKLATAGETHYSISRYSFANSGSNVQSAELNTVLEALMVDKPWECIYRTAQRLQVAMPNSSKQEFEQMAYKRHAAAHRQSFDIPNIDLKAHIASAMALGISFDVVLSCAVNNLNTSIATNGVLRNVRANDINIYCISTVKDGGWYRLLKEGRPKALERNQDLAALRAAGLARVGTSVGTLVLQDAAGKPMEWYCRQGGD